MTTTTVIADGPPPEVAHTGAEVIERLLGACDAGAATEAWFRRNELAEFLRLRLFAFGKASGPMARAALRRLDGRLSEAVIMAPPEWADRVGHPDARVFPVDHPLPTERNVDAAGILASCALDATPDEGVLVLISGGGSAHLTLPRSGITLDDVRAVTGGLLRAGAPIRDINTVRRAMEQLKGGGLRAICPARRVYGLVVSDVIGDDPGVIASGPLTTAEPADPVPILEKWGVRAGPSVLAAMAAPKPVSDLPAANIEILLSAQTVAERLPALLEREPGPGAQRIRVARTIGPVSGEASDAGRELAAAFLDLPAGTDAGNALLAWGETTVRVGRSTGQGGRNLELALAATEKLPAERPWAILAFATDGIDGPTDAAGALLCSEMFRDPRARTLAANALQKHDSYHAAEMLGALLRTGPTGTNCNDFVLFWWRDA